MHGMLALYASLSPQYVIFIINIILYYSVMSVSDVWCYWGVKLLNNSSNSIFPAL